MSRRLALLLSATVLLTACGSGSQAGSVHSPTASTQGDADTPPITTTRQDGFGAEAPPALASRDVSARLTQWLALTTPGAVAPAAEYATFLTTGPRWPSRGLMMARYERALLSLDDGQRAQLCRLLPPNGADAFLRCAPFLPDASERARRRWVEGVDSPADEAAFAAQFGTVLDASLQWQRFERLEASGRYAAARRQIDRLAPARQPLARARLAFRLSAPDADTTLVPLTDQDLTDRDLTLARLRALRRGDQMGDALALWRHAGFAAQQSAPSASWSTERASLARALLAAGSPQDALLLADDRTMPPASSSALDAQFLTGWIQLRALHDASSAASHFRVLLEDRSLLARARGAYWLGRARKALGDDAAARQAWAEAATMPTTFYGQMALASLGGDAQTLTPADTPVPGLGDALGRLPAIDAGAIARNDLVSAATLLAAQGDERHARLFLMAAQAETHDAGGQAALARVASQLRLYEPAVFAARAAGRLGQALYPLGWPRPAGLDAATDSGVPPGLAMAVARQESSFDPDATSPAQAIGLMQFQVGTARDVARRAGLTGLDLSTPGLHDPATSMALGRAYLADLLTRYGNIVPEVLAAYNAGPHRTDQWLAADPLPANLTQDDLIDWIEKLPYAETRSYIQRVEENRALYRWQESSHA